MLLANRFIDSEHPFEVIKNRTKHRHALPLR